MNKKRPLMTGSLREPHAEASATIQFTIRQGDIAKVDADAVALKYAQDFYGADEEVARRLVRSGIPRGKLCPKVGSYSYVDTKGAIRAQHALFIGVPKLWDLGYSDIRKLAVTALHVLSKVAPITRHLAMTLHGPGFGLDETGSYRAICGFCPSPSN